MGGGLPTIALCLYVQRMRPATPCTALQDVTFVRLRFEMVYGFRGTGRRGGRLGSWVPRAALAKDGVGSLGAAAQVKFYSQTSIETWPDSRISRI
jgi:hypothetical protein